MKKIILVLVSFLLLMTYTKALDETPNNTYYLNEGIYAYLDRSEIDFKDEDTKLYVEYRLADGVDLKELKLIEVTEYPVRIRLLDETDKLNNENLGISSRYVLYKDGYDYSNWTDSDKVDEFDYEELPEIKISSLNEKLEYTIDNKYDIDTFFSKYIDVKEVELKYIPEYKVTEWTTEKPTDIDMNDVKVEVRLKYEVGKHTSKYSNTLVYEKHPVKTCPFGLDICCNEFVGVSLCYWVLIGIVLIIAIIIIVDKKKKKNREA